MNIFFHYFVMYLILITFFLFFSCGILFCLCLLPPICSYPIFLQLCWRLCVLVNWLPTVSSTQLTFEPLGIWSFLSLEKSWQLDCFKNSQNHFLFLPELFPWTNKPLRTLWTEENSRLWWCVTRYTSKSSRMRFDWLIH